nr:immunoglobulin light chain junction region [Macaca mulatta]MOX17897.1 immunoglobulin light chain junction region [Macaca mulatta]MOX18015.1 immunoglobulin light chain junction region [Macaca mulatta]MOX18123.1 immunoglobulin light chain junction region [Macaca mulatta]MOX18295.1 immunoglobulin light chain junction region [Macaca mulatta]
DYYCQVWDTYTEHYIF